MRRELRGNGEISKAHDQTAVAVGHGFCAGEFLIFFSK